MSTTAYIRKKNMAAKLAKELAETRALQPRLKRECYQRQAERLAAKPSLSSGGGAAPDRS